MDVYERLKEMNITLPELPRSNNAYVPAREFGDKLVYMSGMGPETHDGKPIYVGKLGRDMDVETGRKAARSVGITMLAQLHANIGDLNRVARIAKVLGFVNCTEDFAAQPAVMNGYSELMCEVFGENTGAHARTAIGAAGLPGGIPVEIEMLVELK